MSDTTLPEPSATIRSKGRTTASGSSEKTDTVRKLHFVPQVFRSHGCSRSGKRSGQSRHAEGDRGGREGHGRSQRPQLRCRLSTRRERPATPSSTRAPPFWSSNSGKWRATPRQRCWLNCTGRPQRPNRQAVPPSASLGRWAAQAQSPWPASPGSCSLASDMRDRGRSAVWSDACGGEVDRTAWPACRCRDAPSMDDGGRAMDRPPS
jgi:hypothetical protein